MMEARTPLEAASKRIPCGVDIQPLQLREILCACRNEGFLGNGQIRWSERI